jgi:hypothetical protein
MTIMNFVKNLIVKYKLPGYELIYWYGSPRRRQPFLFFLNEAVRFEKENALPEALVCLDFAERFEPAPPDLMPWGSPLLDKENRYTRKLSKVKAKISNNTNPRDAMFYHGSQINKTEDLLRSLPLQSFNRQCYNALILDLMFSGNLHLLDLLLPSVVASTVDSSHIKNCKHGFIKKNLHHPDTCYLFGHYMLSFTYPLLDMMDSGVINHSVIYFMVGNGAALNQNSIELAKQ